jgi:hypothetical protein
MIRLKLVVHCRLKSESRWISKLLRFMGETKASCDFRQKSYLNGVDSIRDISPFFSKPKATTEILAFHLFLMPFSPKRQNASI